MSRTTDAVCGGASNATPNGSLFLSSAPVRVRISNLYFSPSGEIGNEQLPDARRHEQPHRVHAAVPAVEVADDADALGVRRPHREVHADRRPDADAMRAELLERAVMRALAEQVQVEVAEHAAVAIRIVDLDDVAAGERDAQPIVGQRRSAGQLSGPSATEPSKMPVRRGAASAAARRSPTIRRSTARAAG